MSSSTLSSLGSGLRDSKKENRQNSPEGKTRPGPLLDSFNHANTTHFEKNENRNRFLYFFFHFQARDWFILIYSEWFSSLFCDYSNSSVDSGLSTSHSQSELSSLPANQKEGFRLSLIYLQTMATLEEHSRLLDEADNSNSGQFT